MASSLKNAAPRNPIRTTGTLLEVEPNGLHLVEIKNGYRVRAHLDRHFEPTPVPLAAGSRLVLEFSPYDMSQARVIAQA